MTELDAIKKEVLDECDEDHVGVWNIIRDIKQFMPKADAKAVRELTVLIVTDLLREKKISAGFPDKEGNFVVWEVPANLVIEFIDREWKNLDREPTIGEIVWFTTLKKAA